MVEKLIYEENSPKTQTVNGVKALITFHNHGVAPAEMPAFYRLTGEMVLVKSNKGDCYYVTTPKDCSCPARTFTPGKPCKHMLNYSLQVKPARGESLFEQVNTRAAREEFYSGMVEAGAV